LRTVRIVVSLVSLVLLATASFAAGLKVKVTDPQSAVVGRARVALYAGESSTATAIRLTSPEGVASFPNLAGGTYDVQVLAPGFAPARQTLSVAAETEITIMLRLATAANAVEVTATRTPLAMQESGAAGSSLDAQQLTLLQPAEAADALRFLPGAIVNAQGRGGQASLFVRGGESRYNKVIIDDVPVNDPGGSFDFGVVPVGQIDRIEFLRGAQSTLYGSDAMTSVVQMWSRTGSTRTPELRLGADGGTFATAHGYASLAGARGRLDYNFFGDQFNTAGRTLNDDYSNSLAGANVGVALSARAFFRLRARHSNSRTGLPGQWLIDGQPIILLADGSPLPPDSDQHSRQNNFLGSAEFTLAAPERWQHRFVAFEYNHRYDFTDPGSAATDPVRAANFLDFAFHGVARINRAGLDYQGEYTARAWARTTFGYHFEDENGWVGDLTMLPLGHGVRTNHAVFGEQVMTWRRVSLIGGLRYEHNASFGDKAVPRLAASVLALRGGDVFSGTRLRFAYATGIMEPRLEESFGVGGYGILPNPNLKAGENRSLEAGVQQSFAGGKYSASATYYNNLFRNRIDYNALDFTHGQYVNVGKDLAHGAELQLEAHPLAHLRLSGAYTYTSTQILTPPPCLTGPFGCSPLLLEGRPLLRRPKHAGSLLATWTERKWGAEVGGSFVGPRPDSDFLFGAVPPVTRAAGYARWDLGMWRALTSRLTAYAALDNAFNRHYEEVVGYPALPLNVRAGLRLRLGGE
jgi:vitamin B12 transporter